MGLVFFYAMVRVGDKWSGGRIALNTGQWAEVINQLPDPCLFNGLSAQLDAALGIEPVPAPDQQEPPA